MPLGTFSSNEFSSSFIVYDTISATPCRSSHDSSQNSLLLLKEKCHEHDPAVDNKRNSGEPQKQGRKKRRIRKTKICKNKEEAETQRMTHIVVERNRRKQMNDHLAALRSLMPEAYVQRGDQASIVGGAIEFVKELEHLIQSLEAKKFQLLHEGVAAEASEDRDISKFMRIPFANFFVYPQYTFLQAPNKCTSESKEEGIADIEVTLIETHASLRILSRRSFRKLSRLVAGFQTLCLTILHLNVTTLDPFVLYSISAKVEEGCQLGTVNDIATAVHHLVRIIDEEASLCYSC